MRILVVINPKSRNGQQTQLRSIIYRKLWPHIVQIVREPSLLKTQKELRRAIKKKRIDTIVAVGGDGTINGVLNEIIGTDIALGIIPTGSANDLANFYGIPIDAESACDVILQQRPRLADVINVNGWYYATAGGLGLASDVCVRANKLKKKAVIGKLLRTVLGNKIYVLAVLLALLLKASHKYPVQMKHNGFISAADSLFLMIQNQPVVGSHFLMTPAAKNDDGQFNVCLIDSFRTRLGIISIILRIMKGRHTNSPAVHLSQGTSLQIHTPKPLHFFADGEVLPATTNFNIKLAPLALNILVPAAAKPMSRIVEAG